MSEAVSTAPATPEVAGAAASPPPPPAADPGVVAAPPAQAAPPPAAPDSVVLTRREFDMQIEKAVARAIESAQSRTMSKPDETVTNQATPPAPSGPTADDVAKLAAKVEEAMAAAKAAREDGDKRAAELQAKLEAAEARAAEEKLARKKAKSKAIEATIRKAAVKAGIEDEDYALVLYAKAGAAAANKKDADGNPAPEAPPQPEEFFAELARTRPALLKNAPARPASTAPAADPPPPPVAGGATGAKDGDEIDKMDQRDFAARTRAKYGFNPAIGI